MKTKIIIILFIAIIAIILIALLMKNMGNKSQVISNNPIAQDETQDETTRQNEDTEDYKLDIPDGYELINEQNISSATNMVVEEIAYHYDSGEDVTYVKVYMQNKGTEAVSKDSICTIELCDENNNVISNFAGVFTESDDIDVGERVVVSTQFIERKDNIKFANVSIETPKQITIEDIVKENEEALKEIQTYTVSAVSGNN